MNEKLNNSKFYSSLLLSSICNCSNKFSPTHTHKKEGNIYEMTTVDRFLSEASTAFPLPRNEVLSQKDDDYRIKMINRQGIVILSNLTWLIYQLTFNSFFKNSKEI